MPTGQQYSSVATQATLTSGISNANTSCNVNTTSGFPAAPFTGTIDIGQATQEEVDVTNVTGLTLTITRGVDGSAAQAHSNGATFTHVAIGRDFREARAHIDASTSNDTTGHSVHGLTSGSSVVGTLDTQTLAGKTLTSPTINSPAVTNLSAASANLTGTVTGAATYDNITVTTTAAGTKPLLVKGIASETASLVDVQDSAGTHLLQVGANGATGAGSTTISPTDTGTTSLTVNGPASLGANLAEFQLNGSTKTTIGSDGSTFAPDFVATGFTGATTQNRYVGGTNGGPPSSGTFVTGDWVQDRLHGIAWVCTSGGTPGTWSPGGRGLIAVHVTPSTPDANVSFNSIPQYFSNLVIEGYAQSNGTGSTGDDNINITWNGLSSNYAENVWIANQGNATVTNTYLSSQSNGIVANVWNAHFATAGVGTFEIKFPGYSNTTFRKNVYGRSMASDGGTVGRTISGWVCNAGSTAAITAIQLSPSAGSFVQGSTFWLYGTN